jgi:glycine cleavage system H protein
MARIDRYDFPDDLWYHPREHLWLRPERAGDGWLVTVGVDAVGQDALGEVVYVQLTDTGRPVARGEAVGSLEAEKMVRPILAPLSGTLREVNAALMAAPRILNRDPYGQGWMFRVQARDWEGEREELVHGAARVTAWIIAELQEMKERR